MLARIPVSERHEADNEKPGSLWGLAVFAAIIGFFIWGERADPEFAKSVHDTLVCEDEGDPRNGSPPSAEFIKECPQEAAHYRWR